MKQIIFSLLAILMVSAAFAQKSSSVRTDTIQVSGVCERCKKIIENAAYIKGVKRADWNIQTQQLIVIYTSKTSLYAIEESIAHAGHDTQVMFQS